MRRIPRAFTTVFVVSTAIARAPLASADPEPPHTTLGPYVETTVFVMDRLTRTALQPGTPPGPRHYGVDASAGLWIRPPHRPIEIRVGPVLHATEQRSGIGGEVAVLEALTRRQRVGVRVKYIVITPDDPGDQASIGLQYHYWHVGLDLEAYRGTWTDHEVTYGVIAGASLDGWPALAALPIEALAIALQME